MQPERMTTKVREALQEAADIARRSKHPEVGPAHLLKALVDQDGGILTDLVRRVPADPAPFLQAIDRELERLPKVEGGDLGLARDLNRLFEAAQGGLTLFIGATILADGAPALIVDVGSLL